MLQKPPRAAAGLNFYHNILKVYSGLATYTIYLQQQQKQQLNEFDCGVTGGFLNEFADFLVLFSQISFLFSRCQIFKLMCVCMFVCVE